MKVNAPTTPSGPSAGAHAGVVAAADQGLEGHGARGVAGTGRTGPNEGPVGRAVAGLAAVDRAMAGILRAVADAGPVDGLPAVRLISLAASTTGWDIRYLRRTTDTLTAMPGVWAAFDNGQISWSQVRGITTAAKGLSGADRHTLDGQLSGAIADNATAEPDRIVEVAGDLAARLDEAAQQRRDTNTSKSIGLRLIPDLFGGSTICGQLDDQLTALVSNALHSAADAPVEDDHQPVDADGKPIPRSWLAPTRRAAQLAEALGRVCAQWLAGRTSPGGHSDIGDSGDADSADVDTANGGDGVSDDSHSADSTADGDVNTGTGTAADGDGDAESNSTADTTSADNDGDVDTDHSNVDPDDTDESGTGADTTDGQAATPDGDDSAGTTSTDTQATPTGGQTGRGAQPAALVIVDLNDLIDADRRAQSSDGTPAATARLLWRLAGGRRRQSNARIHALTCDATYIPVLTDGNIPIAVGDATDPISSAIRRAATARDQGCRFPGCDRPAQFTDLHHVIWREHGGPTELSNLISLCRTCHNLVHQHGWQLTLYDDGRLTVRRGRYRFTSRPRLRPPPCRLPATHATAGTDPPEGPDPPLEANSPRTAVHLQSDRQDTTDHRSGILPF